MSAALVDHCLELLAPLGLVRSRRMFGGHGIYLDELFFALIAFDRLYLKVDDGTREAFAAAGCEPFVYEGKGKPVTMSYWTVPAEAMESPALMAPWARLAMQAALRSRSAVKQPAVKRLNLKPAVKRPVAKRAARPGSKPTGRAG